MKRVLRGRADSIIAASPLRGEHEQHVLRLEIAVYDGRLVVQGQQPAAELSAKMLPLRPRSESAILDKIAQRATACQLHRDVKAVHVFFVRVVLDDVGLVGNILQRDKAFHLFLAALPLGGHAAVGDLFDGTHLDVVVHAFEDGAIGLT